MNKISVKNELHIWVDKQPKGRNQFKPSDTNYYKNNWGLLDNS